MASFIHSSYCPRCDKRFVGNADSALGAVEAANNMVREHLKRAVGADLDDGLHDHALEQWDQKGNS